MPWVGTALATHLALAALLLRLGPPGLAVLGARQHEHCKQSKVEGDERLIKAYHQLESSVCIAAGLGCLSEQTLHAASVHMPPQNPNPTPAPQPRLTVQVQQRHGLAHLAAEGAPCSEGASQSSKDQAEQFGVRLAQVQQMAGQRPKAAESTA
jgi:hypothetical protein